MKASNKQQPTRRNTASPKKKQKRSSEKLATVLTVLVLGIGVIVAIAALLPSVASFFNEKQEKERSAVVQEDMREYLTRKYNGQFIVTEPERNGQMLGSPEEWKAVVHPQSNTGVTFNINAAYESNGGTFNDDYVSELWTKEQNVAIKQKAKEIYESKTSTDVSAKVSISGTRLSRTARVNSPSYKQAVRENPDEIVYNITVKSRGVDDSSVHSDIRKAHAIALWVRSQGVRRIWLDYTVTTNSGEDKRCLTQELPDNLTNNFIEACFASKGDYTL